MGAELGGRNRSDLFHYHSQCPTRAICVSVLATLGSVDLREQTVPQGHSKSPTKHTAMAATGHITIFKPPGVTIKARLLTLIIFGK